MQSSSDLVYSPRRSRADAACLVFVLGIAIIWTSAAIWWHPQLERGDAFIFRDASHVLTVTDDLLSGRTLYKDVFYAYGPIAASTYTVAARLFGNSPTTLLCMQQLLSLTVVALSYRLLRAMLSERAATCFLIVALFPLILLPGSSLADFSGLDYVSLERIPVLLIALLWKRPEERRLWDGLTLGCLLGLLQGVKFGGAFVAGAALLVTDLCYLPEINRDRLSRLCWLKVNLVVLGMFCLIEAGWIAFAFGVLPQDIALDAVWPKYLLKSYQWYVGASDRWPTWHNAGYFVTAQLLVVSCIPLALFGILASFRKRAKLPDFDARCHAGRAVYLAAFFFIGAAIYFRHVWHFTQYAWTLVLAASLGFHYWNVTSRMALAALWLPTIAWSAKAIFFRSADPLLVRETFASGDALWVDHSRRTQLKSLRTALLSRQNDATPARGVIFFPEGGGLHHLFGIPHSARFFWFMGGLVQRHDEDDFVKSVSESDSIVVFFRGHQLHPPETDPNQWAREISLAPTFQPALAERLRGLLGAPIMIDDRCWVFPVKRR